MEERKKETSVTSDFVITVPATGNNPSLRVNGFKEIDVDMLDHNSLCLENLA